MPTTGLRERKKQETRQRLRSQVAVSRGGKTELQSLVDRTRDLPPPGLDLPADAKLPDSLVFSSASSRAVFMAIARFSGLNVVFDPTTRLWTIYWADSHGLKLDGGTVGSFDGDTGEFFAREVFAGKSIIVRFLWDKRDPEAPVWSAAFSDDEGETWEWNWRAHFARLP